MTRTLLVCSSLVVALAARQAGACGCFAPPDPTVPIVQAGERIVFAVKDGHVTAHVQVQYAGGAGAFGWLLPVPAVPELELGSDELFTQLTLTTQPKYRLTVVQDESCRTSAFGGGTATGGAGGAGGSGGAQDAGAAFPSPLVVQASLGPYDYAVLRADSGDAMLQWLADNRYFVPDGTGAAVAPYLRPGGYFLALKLRAHQSAGAVQPVVLRYQGDVGVIPITLTSTGATPDMGVQVFMLGEGRAVPRNYEHTVLNDAVIDWTAAGANYRDVVVRAVHEHPQHHTFVTEYAGPSAVMQGVLDFPGRYGAEAELAAQATPRAFLAYVKQHGFLAPPLSAAPFTVPVLPTVLEALLSAQLPAPEGVDAQTFLLNYEAFEATAPPSSFEPVGLAHDVFARLVHPTLAAAGLFREHPTLTRLFTTLSPEDMNRDPAFAFNPGLPDVSNVHAATLTQRCGADGFSVREQRLVTEQGWVFDAPAPVDTLPASLRIETLPEEGAPKVLVDNAPKMAEPVVLPVRAGCSSAEGVVVLAAAWGLRRRRSRSGARG